MKKLFLLLSVLAVVGAHAQDEKPKLKDLLYGGKLKKDSSGVIRKTDDLTAKIDTSTKKEPEAEKSKTVVAVIPDTAQKNVLTPPSETGTAVVGSTNTNNAGTVITESANTIASGAVVAAPLTTTATTAAPAKTNTKLWKEYSDSLTSFLKAEAFSSKQIKKETYFMSFDYEIGTDGLVTVNTVSSTPSNNYLQAQVKQFLDITPLKLNPVLDGSGQPKKTKRIMKRQTSNVKNDW
jgi:hypothetical protein